MGRIMQRSQVRQRGLLEASVHIFWAVCLVLAFGSLSHHFSSRPSGILLGCAVSVLLAGMINGTQSAVAALITAALLGAYWLPPVSSFYIEPSFRLAYGLFLLLCILISFYRPPSNTFTTAPKGEPSPANYGEEDLPTVITAQQLQRVPVQRTVQGDDLYQWERTCAHLSDLIWDAQIKIGEEQSQCAGMLLQHAHQLAAQMRTEIGNATLSVSTDKEQIGSNMVAIAYIDNRDTPRSPTS